MALPKAPRRFRIGIGGKRQDAFGLASAASAKGAKYESQGQVRAKRARRPWITYPKRGRGLKGRHRNLEVFRPFQGSRRYLIWLPGATRSLRFALAPGSHIARLRRLPTFNILGALK